MTPLALPQPAAHEDKTLATLCKKPEWAGHYAVWDAAYHDYRAAKADPWIVCRAIFTADPVDAETIAEAQRGFYKTRSGSGPLARIRRTPGLLCCPMCGSGHPGTLDHYLPRDAFPEFSILPCNLVPACSHCNSGAKGRLFRGATSPERFIHPYFDTIAQSAIWYVEVQPPFAAARFHPRSAASVVAADRPMVEFHLRHILGPVFLDYMATQWAQFPRLLHGRFTVAEAVTLAGVKQQLADDLRDTIITSGHNGWRTALLRGLIANADAIDFLTDRATKVIAVPT